MPELSEARRSADPVTESLRRQANQWLVAGLLMVALSYFILESIEPGLDYPQWVLLPFLGTIAVWRFLIAHLDDNRRVRDDQLLPRFGLGNAISIFRGLELFLLAGFLMIPRPPGWAAWIPALLYTSAAILDFLDGYAARVRDEATRLGEQFEGFFDGVGLLIATLLAIHYGSLSAWFLPFGAARYLYLLGIRLRKWMDLPVFDLTESRIRRPIAGLTMGFMSAMLWPIVRAPASNLAGIIFVLPFGASFLRDWLVTSGRIDPQSDRYLRVRGLLRSALIDYLPVVVRTSLAVLLVLDVWPTFQSFNAEIETYTGAGFPFPATVVVSFLCLKIAAVPMLLIGAAGRIVAFVLVFPIGLTIVSLGLTELRAGLLVVDLLTLMAGTGHYSLWEPSRQIFGQRVGSPR